MVASIVLFILGVASGYLLAIFAVSTKLADAESLRLMVIRDLEHTIQSIEALAEGQSGPNESLSKAKQMVANACRRIERF
jgi:hypothetical protein